MALEDYSDVRMRNLATFPALEQPRIRIAQRIAASARRVVEIVGRTPKSWLALAGILLAGNITNALSWRFAVPINSGGFSVALALGLYAMPGWGEWRRSRTEAASWRPRWRSTALAIAAGLGLAIPSVLFFAFTATRGGLGYSAIPELPARSLLIREMVEIPLLTALLEELVFRQYVFRAFAQKGMIATVLVNAGIFTLWHLVVNARTVLATNFAASPLLLMGSYVGSLATIFVGGVVFALVRWRTGSFVYSALTHWIVVGLMTLAMWIL